MGVLLPISFPFSFAVISVFLFSLKLFYVPFRFMCRKVRQMLQMS
jgi:hypothetical protein